MNIAVTGLILETVPDRVAAAPVVIVTDGAADIIAKLFRIGTELGGD